MVLLERERVIERDLPGHIIPYGYNVKVVKAKVPLAGEDSNVMTHTAWHLYCI